MDFWIYFFVFAYHAHCHPPATVVSSRNSSLYKLFSDSLDPAHLSTFVVISNLNNQKVEETLKIDYQSSTTTLPLLPPSDWSLSVHLSPHFFYSNTQQRILHVLCYLKFSIENSSDFVNKRSKCVTTLVWPSANISQSSSCDIIIGRSPSLCSTYFNLSNIKFDFNSVTWGSVSAQVFFTESSLIITSFNTMPVVFNLNKSVNWTVVQHDNHFGQLSLGLPITSVKANTDLLLPISVSDTDDISNIRILVNYDTSLSLNSIEVLNKNQWSLKTSFEHLENKESGVIRLQSLNRRGDPVVSEDQPVVIMMNFTVVDKPPSSYCTFRAGISKVDLYSGSSSKYFNKATFDEEQRPVSISIDPDMMDLITFKESQKKTMNLFPVSLKTHFPSFQISTYLIQQNGEHYLPQLIKNIVCDPGPVGLFICAGFEPQKIDNHWALPVSIEHWRTVVHGLENEWRPETWKLQVSDIELNPVSEWRVPYQMKKRGTKCITMYQSASLKVLVRMFSINSMGLRTFLGGTLHAPKPWLDMTSEMVSTFKVTSDPPDIVTLSKSSSNTFLINVNKSGSVTLRLHDRDGQQLSSIKMSVYTSHWASVSGMAGRCVRDIEAEVKEGHPNGEKEYMNVEVRVGKVEPGKKCRLFLEVLFNDGTRMALEDIRSDFYMLEVDGEKFANGDFIKYLSKVSVKLYESLWCGDSRRVYSGVVVLSQNDTVTVTTTEPSVFKSKKELTTDPPSIIPKNLVMIAVYVLVGFILMAVFVIFINCFVAASVRRQPLFQLRRRLSKSRNLENGITKNRVDKTVLSNDHYPSLLPPPGPILSATKQQPEWAASSESGLGIDHSSQGSHPDPIQLSTFRCLPPNGSVQTSESSSYIRQTSPISDPIIDSTSNSSLLFDHLNTPHGCYWALANSKILQSSPFSTERSLCHDLP